MRRAAAAALVAMLLLSGLALAQQPDCTAQRCVSLPIIEHNIVPTNTATATTTPTATITAIPTATPTQLPVLTKIPNGDFEQGHEKWTEIPGNTIITQFASVPARSGTWLALFGGANNTNKELNQAIKLPNVTPLCLHFYYRADIPYFDNDDEVSVWVNTDRLLYQAFDQLPGSGSDWTDVSVDLSAYAGQAVALRFFAVTDSSDPSSLFIDDIRFQSNP
jgi:hypothetical protein